MVAEKVVIANRPYKIIRCPHPLSLNDKRSMFHVDDSQCVIWIDPELDDAQASFRLPEIVSLAWQHRVKPIPILPQM